MYVNLMELFIRLDAFHWLNPSASRMCILNGPINLLVHSVRASRTATCSSAPNIVFQSTSRQEIAVPLRRFESLL